MMRQCYIDVPSGHKMVVVNNFHERLDSSALSNLLLAHSLGDFQWISLYTGHQSVSIRSVVATIVVGLHNQRFPARITTTKHYNYLSTF